MNRPATPFLAFIDSDTRRFPLLKMGRNGLELEDPFDTNKRDPDGDRLYQTNVGTYDPDCYAADGGSDCATWISSQAARDQSLLDARTTFRSR